MHDPDEHVYLPPGVARDPDRPTYSPEGVDLTQVRRHLSLTPLERLRALEAFATDIQRIRARNPGWNSSRS